LVWVDHGGGFKTTYAHLSQTTVQVGDAVPTGDVVGVCGSTAGFLSCGRELSRKVAIPVFAEGRIQSPKEASKGLQLGAYAVVIGNAITRPEMITRKFVDGLRERPKLVRRE
jgi:2,4-dienoyl-CoA reductase-like NADH-dependent reductase (Old Yellow Enzyme family)